MNSKYSKYNTVKTSKYYYKDSNVLKNLFNIKDEVTLKEIESDITFFKIASLINSPFPGKFDIKHLIKIHFFIFEKIYPFAGKLRTVDISKGNTYFCKALFIENELEKLLNQLQNENYLSDLSRFDFIKRSAYYLAELNMIHPFIEGNGRTIREFYRSLAKNSNYEIDWTNSNKKEILSAFIESVKTKLIQLEDLLDKVII